MRKPTGNMTPGLLLCMCGLMIFSSSVEGAKRNEKLLLAASERAPASSSLTVYTSPSFYPYEKRIIQWMTGSNPIVVDGDLGEWDLTGENSPDFYSYLYRARKLEKVEEAAVYMRYDCANEKIYMAVVLENADSFDASDMDNFFVKIDGRKVTDYLQVETGPALGGSTGYEASFAAKSGMIDIHIQVNSDGESQTAGLPGFEVVFNLGQQCADVPCDYRPSEVFPVDLAYSAYLSVTNVAQCAVQCHANIECVQFSFNWANQECDLYNSRSSTTSLEIPLDSDSRRNYGYGYCGEPASSSTSTSPTISKSPTLSVTADPSRTPDASVTPVPSKAACTDVTIHPSGQFTFSATRLYSLAGQGKAVMVASYHDCLSILQNDPSLGDYFEYTSSAFGNLNCFFVNQGESGLFVLAEGPDQSSAHTIAQYVTGGCLPPSLSSTTSPTISYSPTSTSTVTSSRSSDPSRSSSRSFSSTTSRTPLASVTSAASRTKSISETASTSPSPAASNTPAVSFTPSTSRSNSISLTSSISRSMSLSVSPEPSSSRGASPTSSTSISVVPSPSSSTSVSVVPSQTSSPSTSRQPSNTPAVSTTSTAVPSSTASRTRTASRTPTRSITPSPEPSSSSSRTATQTRTNTASSSSSGSRTPSVTPSRSRDPSNSATRSAAPSPAGHTGGCEYINCMGEAVNVFTLNDFSGSDSDVEGQLFVGNDANLNSYSVGAALSNSQGQREDLIVGGKLQFPTGYVPNGNIVFGNDQSLIGPPILNSFNVLNYAREQPGFFNFSAAGTCYRQQSTSYCGMSDSGYKFIGEVEFPPESPAKMVLKLQGGSDYQYALFKVTCDQLNKINEVGFDLPSDTTVVLNVFPGGEPGKCQLKFNHVYSARRLLLNTCGLSEVRLSGNLRASVLAIDANVIGDRGMMDGQLVARSYQGRMQHNNYLFQGCLPASR